MLSQKEKLTLKQNISRVKHIDECIRKLYILRLKGMQNIREAYDKCSKSNHSGNIMAVGSDTDICSHCGHIINPD